MSRGPSPSGIIHNIYAENNWNGQAALDARTSDLAVKGLRPA